MKLKLIGALGFMLSIFSAQSQDGKFEYGINFGFTVYQGDLTPEKFGSFKTQKFAVGLHASRVLNQTFSIRGNVLISSLKGDDALYNEPEYRQQRNFNFKSSLIELSALLQFNITAKNYDQGFSPYVFGGAGLGFVNIKRDWSRLNREYFDLQNHALSDGLSIDSAHSLPKVVPVIPVGAGLRYFFSPAFGINLEAAYRLSFTDYLDGFSQAANPELKDHYANYAVGLIFRPGAAGGFGSGGGKNKMGCPVLKY